MSKMSKHIIFFLLFLVIFLITISVFKNVESFNVNKEDNVIIIDTSISSNIADDFCNTFKGSGKSLHEKCQKLTKTNCLSTECCIWGKDTCVAGDATNGPLFS